jgi:hypothetical protein
VFQCGTAACSRANIETSGFLEGRGISDSHIKFSAKAHRVVGNNGRAILRRIPDDHSTLPIYDKNFYLVSLYGENNGYGARWSGNNLVLLSREKMFFDWNIVMACGVSSCEAAVFDGKKSRHLKDPPQVNISNIWNDSQFKRMTDVLEEDKCDVQWHLCPSFRAAILDKPQQIKKLQTFLEVARIHPNDRSK